MASAASSMPMTPIPASESGGSTPCPDPESRVMKPGKATRGRLEVRLLGSRVPMTPPPTNSSFQPAILRLRTAVRVAPATTCSDPLLAINADTGKLNWHFQFTGPDEHDWDASQFA